MCVGVANLTVYHPHPLGTVPEGTDPKDVTTIRWKGSGQRTHRQEITKSDARLARMEATAVARNGDVINFNPHRFEWSLSPYKYGVGSSNNPLHTAIMAADPDFHSFGSAVLVLEPDWPEHRWYFVGDTGGAIKGRLRFDLYRPTPDYTFDCDAEVAVIGVTGYVKRTPRDVQRALKDLRLYFGKIDGKWGPLSTQAMVKFQWECSQYYQFKIDKCEQGLWVGAQTFWCLNNIMARESYKDPFVIQKPGRTHLNVRVGT